MLLNASSIQSKPMLLIHDLANQASLDVAFLQFYTTMLLNASSIQSNSQCCSSTTSDANERYW